MKSLANRITLTSLLLVICNVTYAKVDTKKEQREKLIAFDLVKKYAKTTACETSFDPIKKDSGLNKRTTIQDVFTIQAPEVNGDIDQSRYYVLWQGNRGCEFANTAAVSEAYHATEVVSSFGPMYQSQPLTVRIYGDSMENINPNLDDEFQFEKNDIVNFAIDKITKINDDVFEIQHRAYGEHDVSNAPTIPIKTLLKFNEKDREWNVISRNIEKNSDYNKVPE
jgi:hypothetical protein